jgi:tetratricopeptide (TPR) repeat protein/tRNA A-37 threonylcarbamoyl transferase component Bud32
MDPTTPIGEKVEENEHTVRITGSSLSSTGGSKVESSAEEFIGQVIFDNYEILEIIGSGGMSVVYKARHLLLNQIMAVKMLHPHLAHNERAIMRFQQEAKSASRLDHNYIVGVREFGLLPTGQAVLIIDYAPGVSLSEIIARGPLEPKRALKICAQVCEALAHAHSQGVIHRDIKPSNVIVLHEGAENESIKIVDFGIAKIVWDDPSEFARQQLTHTGESLGSPPYMSPEQCQGSALDARSDVYSTGCLLFEMLTGRPPFCGGSVFATIHMQIAEPPPPLAKVHPKLANAECLDALVLTALAKDPGQRYQSSADFGLAVRDVLDQFDKTNFFSRLEAHCQVTLARLRPKKYALVGGAVAIGMLAGIITFAGKMHSLPSPIGQAAAPQAMVLSGLDAFENSFREGNKLLDEQDYKAAKDKFNEALMHGDAVGEESQEYQDCLQNLITSLRKTGETSRAGELEQRLSRIKRFSLPLGTIEDNNDQISKLTVVTPQTPEIQAKLARAWCNQATLYLLQHKIALCIDTASSAYKLNKQVLGPNDPNTVRSLSVLVAGLGENGEFARAEELSAQLLRSAEENRAKHPELLADALYRAGRLHLVWGMWLQDKNVIRPETATQMVEFATRTDVVANLKIAEKQCQEAAQMYRQVYGGESGRLADVLTQLGNTQLELGKTGEAYKSLDDALSINLRLRGEMHMSTGKTLVYYGRLLAAQAETAGKGPLQTSLLNKANARLLQAETIFEGGASDTTNSALLGETFNLRALVNAKLGNFDEAEKLYRASIKVATRWNKDCWTARTAYLRLIRLYQESSLPESEKTSRMASLMTWVQGIESIPEPTKPTVKPVNDLDQPIADDAR